MQGIVTPHDHDVLSGRGNFVNYHAGNEHFRALVRKHKVAYVACPKPQKGKFSKMIVDEIKSLNPPGRFLKQDPATKLWYDIGEKKALDKTRQALREGAPEIMKELTTDDDDEDGVEGMQQQHHHDNLSPVHSQKPSHQVGSNCETSFKEMTQFLFIWHCWSDTAVVCLAYFLSHTRLPFPFIAVTYGCCIGDFVKLIAGGQPSTNIKLC